MPPAVGFALRADCKGLPRIRRIPEGPPRPQPADSQALKRSVNSAS